MYRLPDAGMPQYLVLGYLLFSTYTHYLNDLSQSHGSKLSSNADKNLKICLKSGLFP